MTGVGGLDAPRDLNQFITDTRKRLVSLERQINRRVTSSGGGDSGGGGTTFISEGTAIDVTGAGSSGDPYVIGVDDDYLFPPLPDPQSKVGSAAQAISATINVWTDLTGQVLSITPPRDLWVRCDFTANAASSTGYVGVGVAVSVNGGAYTTPNVDDSITGTTSAWGQSPFGFATAQQPITGLKVFKCPAGVTTTFKMQGVRSIASTNTVNYPIMRLVPMYWADVPVPVRPVSGVLTRRSSNANQTGAVATAPVDWNVAVASSGHFTFNDATDEFTCVIPGTYTLRTSIAFGSVAAANFGRVTVYVNGVAETDAIVMRQVGSVVTAFTAATRTLAVGDVVKVLFNVATAGGTIGINPYSTFVELVAVTVDTGATSAADLDTGWQSVASTVVGLTVTYFEARRVGNLVSIRGTLGGAIPTGTSAQEIAAGIPAQFRPSQNAHGAGYSLGMPVVVISRPDGTMAVGNRIPTAGSNLQFTLTYLAG